MEESVVKLVVGSLLHDIGKVLHRGHDGRNHSESGYDFLKNDLGIADTVILDQLRYHHAKELRQAKIEKDSLAYITYTADNIAAGVDRREDTEEKWGFQKDIPLFSIFNVLNNLDEKRTYDPQMLSVKKGINYPKEDPAVFHTGFYDEIRVALQDSLKDMELSQSYINSLLEVLESYLTYIPSSTSLQERADISLFDHMKITAAFSTCIFQYLKEEGCTDYKEELLQRGEAFYTKKAFVLYSMDLSGIQDFIYTVSSKGALKSLRARSFYLEVLMEHVIDELLLLVGLTRTNLLYSGGGHAYLLLSNTAFCLEKINEFEAVNKKFFLDVFKTDLYIAGDYAECSANDLKNKTPGSYRDIFITVGQKLNRRKLHRYQAEDIKNLNQLRSEQSERECKVCRRRDFLGESDKCSICRNLEQFSNKILHESFFGVFRVLRGEKSNSLDGLPLPGNAVLYALSGEELRKEMECNPSYVRAYAKNGQYIGKALATKLWVGDYVGGNTFEAMSGSSQGIHRLGVLRADIDNLGKSFISGFQHEKYGDRFVTVSRTATLSRSLSLFMKHHINILLSKGEFYLDPLKEKGPRKVTIVYSGGDDTFVVGAWDEVIGFSVDLYQSFKKYTQGSLTFSAGIGIFPDKYPVIAMASRTAELEESAKSLENKNGVALFDHKYVYEWPVFIEKVLLEKLRYLQAFFGTRTGYGMNFLYHLLELLKHRDQQINLARYAYLLSRMEPEKSAAEQEKEDYRKFSKAMYRWMMHTEDAEHLVMAIQLYVYLNRKNEEDTDENLK